MLGVAAPLEPLGWTVMVEQPRSEAYAVAYQLTQQLVLIIALALGVTMTVGAFFGRSFIRPIFELMRGTHAVAAGRLEERVTITSKDEFKQLGDAFNSMADKLVELTEDVRKKERQAMFGRMAAGLVHDLSHPVQNIGNSCKLIVRVFDDPEYRQTFTRTIDREIETLKRVLDDLRNVAKPGAGGALPARRQPLGGRHRRVDAWIGRGIGHRPRIAVRVGSRWSSRATCSPSDACTATSSPTRFRQRRPVAASPSRQRAKATRCEVSVSDTGSGIPAERLGAIFDDFVTTKKRGLGLGLAITKRIVEQLGGTIAVASEVGKGTTFTIRFPVAERPVAVAAAG